MMKSKVYCETSFWSYLTDALHIATAAYHGMVVLLTWNCRHLANLFTLPKTMEVISGMGFKCPLIITPERYLEDVRHDD